ncbi:9378_t:CDS:2, partial [Racocetra fulgida]
MIEHSIRGKATSIALRNGLMDGELLSSDGKSLRTITNATRMAMNPNADGDIFTIQELLTAA